MLFQIQNLLRQIDPQPKRIVVGVSGGADSVCLALLLKKLGYEIVLAHLNHGLRGRASDEDAKFVRRFAEKLRVPCVIEEAVIPQEGNLEAQARKVRYAFLEDVRKRMRADCIAVAHHQDDQVETILMNLVRGAALRGTSGLWFKRGLLLRPLLRVGKKEILAFLREHDQPFRHDATNDNLKFLRNRLRHLIIPTLSREMPHFKEDILEFSKQAKRELLKVMGRSKRWIKINLRNGHFSREHFQCLEPEVKGEVLIELLKGVDLYSVHINKLIRFIETGKSGRKMTLKGMTFTIEYDQIQITKTLPRRLPKKRITTSGIRWGQWFIKKSGLATLYVRSWKPGDRFEPAGMRGSKKLQDFFTDKKIPKSKRLHLPIIVNDRNEILSVGNLRWSKKAKRLRTRVFCSTSN